MMIDNTVIVGILSLIGTLAGSYCVGNKTTAVIQERLRALEEKVNKHNNIIERTYKLEGDLQTAFTKIEGLSDDIDNLKNRR